MIHWASEFNRGPARFLRACWTALFSTCFTQQPSWHPSPPMSAFLSLSVFLCGSVGPFHVANSQPLCFCHFLFLCLFHCFPLSLSFFVFTLDLCLSISFFFSPLLSPTHHFTHINGIVCLLVGSPFWSILETEISHQLFHALPWIFLQALTFLRGCDLLVFSELSSLALPAGQTFHLSSEIF